MSKIKEQLCIKSLLLSVTKDIINTCCKKIVFLSEFRKEFFAGTLSWGSELGSVGP